MAPHSSTLAWKIPWTEEPGRLQSMGSLRVGHDWATSLPLFPFRHGRRKWQPTPVFLPGESQGREPGGLPSLGSHRVGHDWNDLAAAAAVKLYVFSMCHLVYIYLYNLGKEWQILEYLTCPQIYHINEPCLNSTFGEKLSSKDYKDEPLQHHHTHIPMISYGLLKFVILIKDPDKEITLNLSNISNKI